MGGGTWHCTRWLAGKTPSELPSHLQTGKGIKRENIFQSDSIMNTGGGWIQSEPFPPRSPGEWGYLGDTSDLARETHGDQEP